MASIVFVLSSMIFAFPEPVHVGAVSTEDTIEENTLRIHYKRQDNDYSKLGLWLWEDVENPTDNWPHGSIPFEKGNQTEYGAYIDIPIKEHAKKIGLLVIDRETGDKDGDDKLIKLFSPQINEVWIEEGSDEVHFVEPINLPDHTVRIHYKADAYDELGLWLWEDVVNDSGMQGDWPTAATPFIQEHIGPYGAYIDVEVKEDAEKISFLVVNRSTGEQSGDMTFQLADGVTQLFIQEGDTMVYTNPYGAISTVLQSGELLSEGKMRLRFSKVNESELASLQEQLQVMDQAGNEVKIEGIQMINEQEIEVNGAFPQDQGPFKVIFNEQTVIITSGWKMMDEQYGYDGELGAELHENGEATLRVWSPKADRVSVVLYDKNDQSAIIAEDIGMTLGDRGVWEVRLNKENTNIDQLNGYYYHYAIEHGDKRVLALDPYAKSMAAWNSNGEDKIGKAAIVNPSSIGPELNFATIEGFEKREDAIIYEVHVRDFTSDPNIADELTSQFGTFAAFVEKLDYIESLGVTHIQLLPVLSYYFANEFENADRMLDYASTNTNYNWGYDPQSYFSLTGMYSENPNDPELRIAEFKRLVDEIHRRGMGVVLDVVYNHTARVEIFEDLVPNYYHFMEADGTPKTSFGGGRLGTTHKMSRRVLVDSIKYLVDEYKVDGFRFDMMGDHDAESIQIAYDEAKKLNPNIVMIGEGWITYEGDTEDPNVMPADQQWMQHTESVGSFSDEFRNELKSGFGSEGEPRFITGGPRNIDQILDNIKAQPHNFFADDPGDVVPYIAAHDNLTLHDVIAQSIKKDPEHHQEEIHQRIRIGNALVLTSQGTAFIHAGQEFGRTKQFRVETNEAPYKSTYMEDENGQPFTYPYFIHDSYDSTDIINRIDWEKATNQELYPVNYMTREYTAGLIKLRRSTDAFRLGSKELIDTNITKVRIPEVNEQDLVIGYRNEARNGDVYYVFINADKQERTLSIEENLSEGMIIVDKETAGINEIKEPVGVELSANQLTLSSLTTTVIKVGKEGMDENEKEDEEEVAPPEIDDSNEIDQGTSNEEDVTDKDEAINTENDKNEKPSDEDKDGETSDVVDKPEQEKQPGEKLPNTATQTFNYLLVGAVIILVGVALLLARRRKK